MSRKLDTMLTKGLGNLFYTIRFTMNPRKTIVKSGTREEMNDRIDRFMELKYSE